MRAACGRSEPVRGERFALRLTKRGAAPEVLWSGRGRLTGGPEEPFTGRHELTTTTARCSNVASASGFLELIQHAGKRGMGRFFTLIQRSERPARYPLRSKTP